MATQVQVHEPTALERPRVRMLRPVAEPSEVLAVQDLTRDLVQKALKEGRDYGTVPGVERPTLLKPGAERILLAFGCTAAFHVEASEIDHDREVRWVKRKKVWRNQFKGDRAFTWGEESGVSLGLYRYVVRCDLTNRDTGEFVASFSGSCSTLESKYVDRPRECENTVLKMACKRALVGAVLVAFGLSDQFTQDVEDAAGDRPHEPEPEPEPEPITRDTPLTFGRYSGTPLKDLATAVLEWAVVPGRRFGPRTEEWQRAMKAELDRRNAEAEERRVETETETAGEAEERPAALRDTADDLPF
jgi:hypothetical protein